jgi:hypothetical protein
MTNMQTIAEDNVNAFWWRARTCFTGVISIFHNAGEDFAVEDDEWVYHKMEDHKSLIALGRFVAVEAIPHLEGLKSAAALWERRARGRGWKGEEGKHASPDDVPPDDYHEMAMRAGFCLESMTENGALLFKMLDTEDRLSRKHECAALASEVSDDAVFGRSYLDKLRGAAEICKGRAVEAGWPEATGPAFPVIGPGKNQGDLSSERHRLAGLMLDESLSLEAIRAARVDSESQAEEMGAGARV